ncbi:MAG: hypothetical protein U0835_00005, partial [Isosphaeraceae bacterium]
MSFADRFERKPNLPFTQRIRPARDQPLLSFGDDPPGPISATVPSQPSASTCSGAPNPPSVDPAVAARVDRSVERPPLAGPQSNGGTMDQNQSLPTGLKAKAWDIITAITTLKNLERDRRSPTEQERGHLARFGGFGPVAKEIFPDPVSGVYKPGWREIGEELKSLLTAEEYASAKRTTFSQYFTSPLVMGSMHEALDRLGVPADGVVLEPGCGIGRFMTRGHRYVGVELDGI